MIPNFEEILSELSYRIPEGIIDLTKPHQVNELIEILKEHNISSPTALAQKATQWFTLLKEDDIVKNKKTGNIYTVKTFNPDTHVKPTPAEIDKAKGDGEIKPEPTPNIFDKPTEKDTDAGETLSLDSFLDGIEDTSNTIKGKDSVKAGANAILNQLDKFANAPNNPNADSHKKTKSLIDKMFNGESLGDDEKAFLYQFIRIAEPTVNNPNSAKFYIAKEPNNFKGNKRAKIEIGSRSGGTPTLAAFRKFTEKAGLSQMSASTFGTKLTTANQTFTGEDGKVKLIMGKDGNEWTSVVKNENDIVTSINFGDTKLTRLDLNDPNISETELKLRERNNRNMDDYSRAIEKRDLKFIDMDEGVTPDTPENRVIVIRGALTGMATRLRELANKSGTNEERVTNIIDSIDTFAERNPNESPQEWFKDLKAVMSSIANDEGEPSLRESWANYAEVYAAIVAMHDGGNGTENGACALLPESTTLQTVDVLTINTNGVGERRIVTLDGKSVKKGVGAPSALTSKAEKSTYKNDKDGTKKTSIIELSKSHDDIYRMKLDEPIESHTEYQTKYRSNLIDTVRELGVSGDYITTIEDALTEPNRGWVSVGKALAQIELQRTKKNIDASAETMKKIRMRLESYYLYNKLAHDVYNTNVDIQDFSNDSILSQSDDRGGTQLVKNKDIKIDSSDGVNILAYIKSEFNVGTWGDGGRSGNAGAGRFHNAPKK